VDGARMFVYRHISISAIQDRFTPMDTGNRNILMDFINNRIFPVDMFFFAVSAV
jgi:hypothetical protein